MKTLNLFRASAALIVSGVFAASTLAGPGPQYWNRPSAKPAEKPTPVKMNEHPSGNCDGCKTTPIWVVGDRGPAGKGAPGARITGNAHACTGCVGTVNGKVKSNMQHGAGCVKLVCCK